MNRVIEFILLFIIGLYFGWFIGNYIFTDETNPLDAGLIAPLTIPNPTCDSWAVKDGHAVRCIWYIKSTDTQ